MDWLVPILVLAGIIISLIGDRNTKKYGGNKAGHSMPPPPPPKNAFKPAETLDDKKNITQPSVGTTIITSIATDLSTEQPAVGQTTAADERGNDVKIHLKGSELARAMVMMEILGPSKSERYKR